MIKGKSVYNIIVMRDTSRTTRYRISSFWLRMGVLAVLLLILLGGGGAYLGISKTLQNQSLQRENKQLHVRLQQSETQLKRLSNVAQILDSYDNEELQSLETSLAENRAPGMIIPVDLEEIFTKQDMQIVLVDNVQGKFREDVLHISYSINNLQTSGAVKGESLFSFVTREGVLVDIGQKDRGYFEIRRFKPIKVSLPLPEDMEREELFGVRLKIQSDSGKTIFSETFPLSHILS